LCRFSAVLAAFDRDRQMMKNALALLLLSCMASLLPAQAQTSGDAESGIKGSAENAKGKISMCIGCHGIPMYKTAFPEVYSVPMIAGQSPDYIVKALQAYRAGDRSHPSMRAIARSLTDQDMADIAAYYGSPGRGSK
jgi:cytochrome c553